MFLELSKELIILDYKYDRISKITANGTEGGWNQYRTILEVKDKKTRLNEEIDFYSKFLDSDEIISASLNDLNKRLLKIIKIFSQFLKKSTYL